MEYYESLLTHLILYRSWRKYIKAFRIKEANEKDKLLRGDLN